MFFINTIIDLDMGEFAVKIIERLFDIFIVFFGALATARFGYIFWLKRRDKELAIDYQGKYLSSLGRFLNLTQIEIELRKDNKNDNNSQKIHETSLERSKIEYQIDMARVKMRINKIDDYISSKGKIHIIDQMFKKVFVNLDFEYDKQNKKKCTLWKAFSKSKKSQDEINQEIDKIREHIKQNF